MATYKYIGTMTKANGRVDVIVPQADGNKLKFTDAEPNVTILDVGTDEVSIRAMDNSVDLNGQYNYERVS